MTRIGTALAGVKGAIDFDGACGSGYNNVDRTTWYDDVGVAPQRVGCLP
jgi:hypothetical protein